MRNLGAVFQSSLPGKPISPEVRKVPFLALPFDSHDKNFSRPVLLLASAGPVEKAKSKQPGEGAGLFLK